MGKGPLEHLAGAAKRLRISNLCNPTDAISRRPAGLLCQPITKRGARKRCNTTPNHIEIRERPRTGYDNLAEQIEIQKMKVNVDRLKRGQGLGAGTKGRDILPWARKAVKKFIPDTPEDQVEVVAKRLQEKFTGTYEKKLKRGSTFGARRT